MATTSGRFSSAPRVTGVGWTAATRTASKPVAGARLVLSANSPSLIGNLRGLDLTGGAGASFTAVGAARYFFLLRLTVTVPVATCEPTVALASSLVDLRPRMSFLPAFVSLTLTRLVLCAGIENRARP
jgi:hypothetical protein